MKYNGIVVDLGAQYTQISPVNEGYTSCLSSGFFKVTGQMCDEHLFRSLFEMYTPPSNVNNSYPNMDILSLFKIKMDLKETIFSPYKVPFNYEVLQEKNELEPENKGNSYKQYILPDGKTLVNTDSDIDYL